MCCKDNRTSLYIISSSVILLIFIIQMIICLPNIVSYWLTVNDLFENYNATVDTEYRYHFKNQHVYGVNFECPQIHSCVIWSHMSIYKAYTFNVTMTKLEDSHSPSTDLYYPTILKMTILYAVFQMFCVLAIVVNIIKFYYPKSGVHWIIIFCGLVFEVAAELYIMIYVMLEYYVENFQTMLFGAGGYITINNEPMSYCFGNINCFNQINKYLLENNEITVSFLPHYQRNYFMFTSLNISPLSFILLNLLVIFVVLITEKLNNFLLKTEHNKIITPETELISKENGTAGYVS